MENTNDTKKNLYILAKCLKRYSNDVDNLISEMDDMSESEFVEKSTKIQKKYEQLHIFLC